MSLFRNLLIFLHRYLGIALCVLFVVWFISGIAMIYAKGMPGLTAGKRLERLPALDFRKIRIQPSDAAQRAGVDDPSEVLLLTIMNRPAYRFSAPGLPTIFADNGELMNPPGPKETLTIASRFLNQPESALHHLRILDHADQWTLGSRRLLPLHKIAVDDDAHTELYVSEKSGEVAVVTTRGSRALAWVSAIPHWLYFEILMRNGNVWRLVVLWASGLGTFSALTGIVIASVQYSRRTPHIPYAGWMRWHYITGAMFGVFTLTWVFSGFLSMEPWDWASQGGLGDGMRQSFSGGPLDLTQFPKLDVKSWSALFPENEIKEVEYRRIQGDAYYAVRGNIPDPILVSAGSLQIRNETFSKESLLARAADANPGIPISETTELTVYDAYYYARDGAAPLPVLRVKFGDPESTWFYIDPKMGRIVARFQRHERLQRWIYHGLHSLDFSFWYYNRPLWDIGVIGLCAGGALLSAIGVYISFRRLRTVASKVRSPKSARQPTG